MAMASREDLPNLDPAALAIAEVRAGQAGLTLEEWLNWAILAQGSAPAGLAEPSRALHSGSVAIAASGHQSAGGAVFPAAESVESAGSALHLISTFQSRVSRAAVLLSAAFAEAAVTDFKPVAPRRSPRGRTPSATWYADVVRTCLDMSHKVRSALVHPWEPTARAENLAEEAFLLLSGLTPAASELLRLHRSDRRRAYAQLARHLDAITREFELSAELVAEVEATDDSKRQSEDQQFAELRDSLLKESGGSLSLTQAANLLGVSRQALHKRIKAGSALGMMRGTELVLPRAQFVQRGGGRFEVLTGIPEVVKLFNVAGGWSALQFLVEADPNLARPPIQALAQGRVDEVVNAAKAYLDADHG
jgi:hypothetical protein